LGGAGASANAEFRTYPDDGIAASPKVRAQLNERKRRYVATPMVVVVTKRRAPANLAASPKQKQRLAEQSEVWVLGVTTPSTTAPVNDGIAASPKVRSQMNGHAERFEIAPVK